jgi:hypothetical protein
MRFGSSPTGEKQDGWLAAGGAWEGTPDAEATPEMAGETEEGNVVSVTTGAGTWWLASTVRSCTHGEYFAADAKAAS